MSLEQSVATWLLACLAALLLQMGKRRRSSGLLLVYVTSLSLIDWIPALMYLPATSSLPNRDLMEVGMELSALSALGILGGVALAYWRRPHALFDRGGETTADVAAMAVLRALKYGCLLVLLSLTPIGDIPTIGTVVRSSWVMVTIFGGVWIGFAYTAGRRMQAISLLITLVVSLPMASTFLLGFLGLGASLACLAVVSFLATVRRGGPIGVVLLCAAVLYVGMSVFVPYMKVRSELRYSINTGADLRSRMELLAVWLEELRPFDVSDPDHQTQVSTRLDQLTIVGRAERNISIGRATFAHGSTIVDALVAIVPRIVWPEKPVTAGSAGIVTAFTGMAYAEGTSVGATQLFESYVNFGRWGVLVFFFCAGSIAGWADERVAFQLAQGDTLGSVRIALGVAPLVFGVGGSFVELTASSAGGLLLATALGGLGILTRERPRVAVARGREAVV